jgi:hypothetical protein
MNQRGEKEPSIVGGGGRATAPFRTGMEDVPVIEFLMLLCA